MINIENNTLNNEVMSNKIMNAELTNSTSENYDMQQLMNIVGENAISTGQIALSVKNINKQMGIMSIQMNDLADDMSSVKGEIEILKLNEEVTTNQQETITKTAKRRVSEILNYDDSDMARYFRTFIGRCYSNARRYAGLGSKISMTKKGDYQRVIDYIEAWIPINGCAELKAEVDRKAEANRIARELGY